MARSQIYKQRPRACNRCGETSTRTEKVSHRILPPDGGVLCMDCLVPSALDAHIPEEDNARATDLRTLQEEDRKCG